MKIMKGINVPMIAAVLLLASCTGGSGGGTPQTPVVPVAFTVGGTVSGISSAIVVRNNGSDDLTMTKSGSFTFTTALASGTSYNVTIASLPAAQSCVVRHGNGTIAGANVTNVDIQCIAAIPAPQAGNAGSVDANFGTAGKVTTDFSSLI